MKYLFLSLAVVTVLAWASTANAVVITPTSVSYVGTAGETFTDENVIISGAGLTDPLAADESNLATVGHGGAQASITWVTEDPEVGGGDFFDLFTPLTVIFDFDLGGTFNVDKFVSWGYKSGGPNGNSISSVRLDFSTDGGSTIDSSQTVDVAFPVNNDIPADIIALTPTNANFITMEVLDNYWSNNGGDRVGISEIRFTGTVLSAATGDFDGDLDVDGADFLAWQRGESPDSLSATDLALWEADFGNIFAAPAVATVQAVPEPASLMLIVLGMCGIVSFRRRFA